MATSASIKAKSTERNFFILVSRPPVARGSALLLHSINPKPEKSFSFLALGIAFRVTARPGPSYTFGPARLGRRDNPPADSLKMGDFRLAGREQVQGDELFGKTRDKPREAGSFSNFS